VDTPEYYKGKSLTVDAVINDFDNLRKTWLGFAFKYIVRAGKKDLNKYVDDLYKAIHSLELEIDRIEKKL